MQSKSRKDGNLILIIDEVGNFVNLMKKDAQGVWGILKAV
jgi:hypothetical protein